MLASNTGTLARTGYAFADWNTQTDGLGASYAEGGTYSTNSAATLYAKWTMNPYTSWMLSTFANAFTDTAATSNPDSDSLNNLQEFAFGMDPTRSLLAPLSYVPNGDVIEPGVPVMENAGTAQAPNYRAVFARRKDYQSAGLSYAVQYSADLSLWTTSASTPTLLTNASSAGDMDAVSVPFPTTVPVTGGGPNQAPKFFRVSVSGN